MVVRELLIAFGVVTDTEAVDDFDKRIDEAREHMNRAGVAAGNMRAAVSDLIGWFVRGVTAVAGFAAGLVYLGNETAEYAQNVERQAAAIGLTTDAYQEVRKTFELFGVDQRDIADLFGQIGQQALAATRGASGIAQAFTDLGIPMDRLKTANPLDLLDAIADGAARTHDPIRRLASLSTLLGEDLTKKLAPLLQQGAAGIAKFRAEVRKSGNVLSGRAIEDAKRYRASVAELGLTLEGVKHEIGAELIPVLTELSSGVLDYVKANRAAISAGIETFTRRVSAGFRKVRDVVVDADNAVRTRLGGWGAVLNAAAVAVGVLAAGFAAFKTGSAIYYGLTAIEAAISAIAVVAGVSFGVAAGAIAIVGVALAQLLVIFGAVYLFWDDFFTLLRGGDSVIGTFLDAWRDAPGVMGDVVSAAEATIRILTALGTIALQVGGFVSGVLGGAFEVVANGMRGWIMLFDYFIGSTLRNLGAAIAASGLDTFAMLLEQVATGLESISQGDPWGLLKGQAGAAASSVASGPGMLAGQVGAAFRATPAAASGGSTTSNNTTVGGNTYQISGADPVAIVNEIDRRGAARRRAALQGFMGADL